MKFGIRIADTRRVLVLGSLCAGLFGTAQATPVTYNFDALSELESVATQFAGMSFTNASILTAVTSLNEQEFPPASGPNVVVDDGGPLSILFTNPVFSVGAAFTYTSALSFSVYDNADVLLGTVSSLGNLNVTSNTGGLAVNELLSFADVGGRISRLVISGDALGFSFVMDDLTVDFGTGSPVPEPATLALVAGLLGIGVLPGGWMRRPRPH